MLEKLSVVIGNGNMGYMVRMCLYSLMEHCGQHIDELIISDNSSTDYTIQFLQENKYKDITKVVTYDDIKDRTETEICAIGKPWDLGINNSKNEYCMLTHADIVWKSDWIGEFLNKDYDKKPFMWGCGGGGTSSQYSRIHEWGLIINVAEFKKLGISFSGVHLGMEDFDTGAFLYRKAIEKGLPIISIFSDNMDTGLNMVNENRWFSHYCAGAKKNKQKYTEMAKGKYN